MRLTGDPKGQIVLFDDVVTTGSHFIAGYNLLRENGYSVRGAIAAVRSLLPEDEQPVVFNIEPFEIRLPEDWFGGISLQDFLSSGN
ncbi:adenine/guanine phosphoribosyltransferase-like PRPP-binding protein [Inquilinus ginsengisoli]|uniref:Adenine/guanine phosphoribosyltransferase-like PRPP-binding protein n=1 Tax=Inquilinus ginsengisoli TaxID=363840 RepID=A0ABU1JVP8_9PROT|nr:hypothetical protein [Inquilinus ginsengisoli]MDR6292377.1 adenine/guanine phosphoribosyltransferase-like PRPP-binding protein [Inquilinus ginsengisoli]